MVGRSVFLNQQRRFAIAPGWEFGTQTNRSAGCRIGMELEFREPFFNAMALLTVSAYWGINLSS